MATSTLFWESSTYGPGDTNSTYEFLSGRSPNRYHLMRLLRKKGMREVGEILFTALAENTPSDTASVTVAQLTASATPGGNNDQGGVRTTTSKEIMGLVLDSDKDDATAETARAATAADVTTLNLELIPSGTQSQRKPTEANSVDLSGNGGGGKFDEGR
jgi:hypothetical protein